MINLAIVSPGNNAYSETFIQAHKLHIKCRNFFYYGGHIPTCLEGVGLLAEQRTFFHKAYDSFALRFMKKDISRELVLRSFKKNNVQAVLAEYGVIGGNMTSICKELNLPLYVFFHGQDAFNREMLQENAALYENMFEYASKVFVVSKAMYAQLIQLGCEPEKLILNTYGPDNNFLTIEPSYISKNVLASGRFVDKKAPYFTILAFNKVLQQHPDAKLLFAGDGILLNTCINLVKFLKIEHNVMFLGVVDAPTFKMHLQQSSVFVQHSLTAINGDSEGTPVVILEAQAAGLPVVSTLHAGIPDVVQDSTTGYLVEEGDVEGMAFKINSLLDDTEKAKEMGKLAKKRIYENFSMDRHIKAIETEIISFNYKYSFFPQFYVTRLLKLILKLL